MIDLTAEEQDRVRIALRYLRVKAGGWERLSPVLGFKRKTIANVSQGQDVSATMAFRVARFAGVPLEQLLAGKFPPPGTCPHCGRAP